ncbi:hypothetical protein HZS_5153 [Henneguya salminicola]|nr:hypothetical protein HZS_5153 [Henneguya salminicola]
MLGGTAAAVSKTVAAPLERIKLLVQNESEMIKQGTLKKSYGGFTGCARHTYTSEGLLPFWRGNLANVIRYFPTQALNFSFLDKIKSCWSAKPEDNFTTKLYVNMASGGCAGSGSLLFVYSLDYARTRLANDILQSDKCGGRKFAGLSDVYVKTFKSDGIRGLYRGFGISCVGIFVYRGIYFGLYDTAKPILRKGKSNIVISFLLAYAVTILGETVTYPIDTVRRRMMMTSLELAPYKNSFEAAFTIFKQEGTMAFFKAMKNILFFVTIYSAFFSSFFFCSHIIIHGNLIIPHHEDPFKRPFTDFLKHKKDQIQDVALNYEEKKSTDDAEISSEKDENVYITNVESGPVRILPVIEFNELNNLSYDIHQNIQSEKKDIRGDFDPQSFFQNIIERDNIYPSQSDQGGQFSNSYTSNIDSSKNSLRYDSPLFIHGSFPIVLEEWKEAYKLPGWYTEQTDNMQLISDYIYGIHIQNLISGHSLENEMDLKKSALPSKEADAVYYHIPININGTLFFDIPKNIFNNAQPENSSSDHIFKDFLMVVNSTNNEQNLSTYNSSILNVQNVSPSPALKILSEDKINSSLKNETFNIQNQTIKSDHIQIPAYLQYSDDMDYYEQTDASSYKHIDLLTRTRVHDKILTYPELDQNYSTPYYLSQFNNLSMQGYEQDKNNYEFFGTVEPSQNISETDNSPLYGIRDSSLSSYPSPTVKNVSRCEQTMDPGFCYLIISRFYFNILTKKCHIFNYTGCGGNLNNFVTIAECESYCIDGFGQQYYYVYVPDKKNDTDDRNMYSISQNSKESDSKSMPNIRTNLNLNATMNFIITKLWTSDMDTIYSRTRIALWEEIDAYVKNSYLNIPFIKPILTMISKYYDPYINLNFTQISVTILYSKDYKGSLYDPMIQYMSSDSSNVYSFEIMRETINVSVNNSLPETNICQRMDIPMISICWDTPYGCCQDEVMTATGLKHQGCPEINCPCNEFLFSLVLDLTEKQFEDFNEDSPYGNSYMIYTELVDYINSSYDYKIIDVFVDSRKCDAHERESDTIRSVYIIDMAISLKSHMKNALEPIISLAKKNKIGKIPIVKNSLIITAAYGVGNYHPQKRNKILVSSQKNHETKSPVFKLSFNEENQGNYIQDSSGNNHKFILSDSFSLIKRRTLSNEYNFERLCSGTFYPKRNEIATLDLSEKFPIYFNEMTFSFWLLPFADKHPDKKNGIIYAVVENSTNANNSVQNIWPAINILDKNLSATWGDLSCSAQLDSQKLHQWSHLIVYYNIESHSVSFYQNGQRIGLCDNIKTSQAGLNSYFLKKIILGDSNSPFEGAIDEMTMYNTKLPDEKIKFTYENCQDSNIYNNIVAKNLCKPECPPAVLEKQTKVTDTNVAKFSPISTCRQYLNRCNRKNSGVYKIVLPSTVFQSQNLLSPYKSLSTYCDMNTSDGGWTLILTNKINSKWRPDEIFNKFITTINNIRNGQNPSISESFSVLKFADALKSYSDKSFEYMIRLEYDNKSYGVVVLVQNKNISFLSEVPTDADLVLVRKFGPWDYFSSSFSQRIPWVMYKPTSNGMRYPILTSSINSTSSEGVILDTFENGFKFFNFDKSIEQTAIITYWLREGVSPSYYSGGFIDISGIEAEITAYYLSAQLINTENISVVVEYSLGGSRQFLKMSEKNSTTIFTVIQSITMPISVTMRVYEQYTNEPLLLNCREELNVPIYYLKDDLFIATISKECESLYPELFEYYYDYIIYNSLPEGVVLKINVLNISNSFVIPPQTNDDWKGSVTYMQNPNFIVSARTVIGNRSLLINNNEYLIISPQENKNKIFKIIIAEINNLKSSINSNKCYYSMEVFNDAIISIDLTWREDILLAVIDPNEKIMINYELDTSLEDFSNNTINIQVYSHDIKLFGIVDTFVNQNNHDYISCRTDRTYKKFILSSNITDFSKLQTEIKNRKIMLAQNEEQICPPIIHGGYSPWSQWSECEGVCSFNGTRKRHRSCNFPTPENGGMSCFEQGLGSNIEMETCSLKYCKMTFNTSTPLIYDLDSYSSNNNNPNMILEFVNSLKESIAVHMFIEDFSGKSQKYLNLTIEGSGTKTVSFNNTIFPLKSDMKITAFNLVTGKLSNVGGNKELKIGNNGEFKKLSIVIGNMTDIKSYFLNIRFINNSSRKVRLIFNKENSTSFSTINTIKEGNSLALKTKINSIVPPNPYIISCDSGDGTDKLFLNGDEFYKVSPFQISTDLLLIIITNEKVFSPLSVKHLNVMFQNTLSETVKLSMSTIYGVNFITLGQGELISYYQRIFSPIEVFLSILCLHSEYDGEPVLIDSLRSVQYVAENSYFNIRLYAIGKKDMLIDLSTYYLKIRVVNLASQPAALSWRKSIKEDYIPEGHEKRINYAIYSSIRPSAIVASANLFDRNSCFVNGRVSTYIIPSKNPVDYTTILLSEGSSLGFNLVSDYTMNSNNDFIDLNISVKNTLNKFVILKWGWSEEELNLITISPMTLTTYQIQAPASDPLVFLGYDSLTNKSLLVNGTVRFGVLPSQFSSQLNLYVGKEVLVRKVGFKLLNENINEDVIAMWKYGDNSHFIKIPKNSGVDLQLRLQDFGLNWTLSVSAKNSLTNQQLCVTPHHYEFHISSYGLEQLSKLTSSLFEFTWIIINFPVFHDSSSECLYHKNDLAKILAIKIASNYTHDIHLYWYENGSPHSLMINAKNSPTLIFSCFNDCPISKIQLSALTLDKKMIFLNGQESLLLPYSSEFSTTINPVLTYLMPSNVTYSSKGNYIYNPVVINSLNEPITLFWRVKGNGWEKYVLPTYASTPFSFNLTSEDVIEILLNSLATQSKSFHLINGMINYTYTPEQICPPYCESTEQLVVHEPEDNIFGQRKDTDRFTFENKLMKTVSISITPGDYSYKVEPLGVTVVDINFSNITHTEEPNVIYINAFDINSGFSLKLNESLNGLRIFRKNYSISYFIVIKAPDIAIIPTHSFVFNEESLKQLTNTDIIDIHGVSNFYSTVVFKTFELQGIYLDGVNQWVGLHLPSTNCMVYPNLCNDGVSFAIRIKIPFLALNSDSVIKIIDTGSDGGSSSGVSLQSKGYKLFCRVTSITRTWQVSTVLYNDDEMYIFVSWNQDEGLNLYINGSVLSTDSTGDSILYAPSIEMSPNLLLGRGFNKNNNNANKFVVFSLTIFPKNIREKEATAIYLYLISNKFSKAVITNLRVVNDFGRVIRLIPNKGMIPTGGLLIKPGNKYQILSLIDLFALNPSQSSKMSITRSNIDSQKMSIYAEDYEYGLPLYINNRPSPYTFKTDQINDDYVNVVISSKTPDVYPIFHWVFKEISDDIKIVPKTNPPVYHYGNIFPSKDKNGGLLLDGFTGNFQIEDVTYQCIFNPSSCDKGTTLMLHVRLEESLGGNDKTSKFILDTGGHNGEGFSIYLLGGRIVAEVALNKQIWKLESGISYGEWLILILVWDPNDGGKLELYSNGKLLERASRAAEKQGFSHLRNQTIYIGTSSAIIDNEKLGGARFSIKIFSLFDQYLDKSKVMNQFLFYCNHNQPVNYPRYINTNFENRAGVDVIVKPDKGEHKDEGYSVNNGLMLELRLEEKGPVTTYPVIFKAYGVSNSKNLLISAENSLLVMPNEEQNKVVEAIITSKLNCEVPQGLFKDPSDKASYITCQDGIAMRQKCPSDSFWDEDIKSCKPPLGQENLNNIPQHVNGGLNNFTGNTSYKVIMRNLSPFPVKVFEKTGKIDSFIVSENSSSSRGFNLSDETPLNLYAIPTNDTNHQPLLLNGKTLWPLTIGLNSNITSIIIYQGNRIVNNEIRPFPSDNKNKSSEQSNIYNQEITTVMRPKEEKKFTTPIPNFQTSSTISPPMGELSIIRFAFIASNMVSQRIKFEDKYLQMNTIELKPNQTARVFLEGEVRGSFVIFVARYYNKSISGSLKINGIDEIKIPVSFLRNKIAPPGAIVIHTNNQDWKSRRDLLLNMIYTMKNSNPEYKSVFMRIYKTFSDEVILRENTGSSFEIKIKKSDSMIDTTALDVSIKVLKNLKEIHLIGFLSKNKEPIYINGFNELNITLGDSFTPPISIIIHMKNQDWGYYNKKVIESLTDKYQEMGNQRNSYQNTTQMKIPRDMIFIVATFINTANEDVRTRSISGPLLIDTIFRKATTSRITMWLPVHSRVELICLDKFGNILLMNGNSTIIIDTDNYPSKPFYITLPNNNEDLMDQSQTDTSEGNGFGKKSAQLYKIRNHLDHNNIKLFVIGKENKEDTDEKIYSFPSVDQLVFDQPLFGEKILATDTTNGNLLSINGKPYFQEKENNQYKKDYLVELTINTLDSELKKKQDWPKPLHVDESRLRRWLENIEANNI